MADSSLTTASPRAPYLLGEPQSLPGGGLRIGTPRGRWVRLVIPMLGTVALVLLVVAWYWGWWWALLAPFVALIAGVLSGERVWTVTREAFVVSRPFLGTTFVTTPDEGALIVRSRTERYPGTMWWPTTLWELFVSDGRRRVFLTSEQSRQGVVAAAEFLSHHSALPVRYERER